MKLDIEILIIAILSGITLVNLVLLIINNKKVQKYKKYYEKALAKFNSYENVGDEFNSIYDRLNSVENISKEVLGTIDTYDQKAKSNIQKVGLVKYNAYDETENKLSFALVLLDENLTGVLLNHVYSKHGSAMYAKRVIKGKIEERISEEEALALKNAIEDKTFIKSKEIEVEIPKVKTKKKSKWN